MSTGVGMSSCCLSGKLHSGKPVGREEDIAGLSTYVSEPEGQSKAKTVVFICDIFGYKFNNIRLLADEYAKAGFYVYVPDFHQGDSLPLAFLNDVEPPLKEREQLTMIDKGVKTAKVGATLGPWLATHREGVSRPLIEGFVNHLKTTPGTNKIGAIGFCWGGRYAILLAAGLVDAAFAAHPSLVAIPDDFDPITTPTSLAVGDQDSLLSNSEVEKIQDLLNKKTNVPTEVKVYNDQVHGFALRGDWSSDKDKKAQDDASSQGIQWFNKYLSDSEFGS